MDNNVSYSNPVPPATYECMRCHAINVKLWREYKSVESRSGLLCATCAAKFERISITDIDAEGAYVTPGGRRINSIGWYVPAIPKEEIGFGYWDYDEAPLAGVTWWKALPTLKQRISSN